MVEEMECQKKEKSFRKRKKALYYRQSKHPLSVSNRCRFDEFEPSKSKNCDVLLLATCCRCKSSLRLLFSCEILLLSALRPTLNSSNDNPNLELSGRSCDVVSSGKKSSDTGATPFFRFAKKDVVGGTDDEPSLEGPFLFDVDILGSTRGCFPFSVSFVCRVLASRNAIRTLFLEISFVTSTQAVSPL